MENTDKKSFYVLLCLVTSDQSPVKSLLKKISVNAFAFHVVKLM